MAGQDIDISINEASLLAQITRLNKALANITSGVPGAVAKAETELQRFSKSIATVNDRAVQSQRRYIESLERTAASYGKSGVERLTAARDNEIRKLDGQTSAINRVTAAYNKMIEAEKKTGGGGGHGFSGPGGLALRGVRDLFEGRTAYGEVMVGRSLASLSGTPLVLGSIAAGLAAVATAGYLSAKSLASFGVEVKDVELRTGLSAREVAQFTFAAKAVGQDVTVTERLMRGLSQALGDMSPAGEKARRTLADLGVDTTDVNGQLKPTGQLLLEISRAFEHLPPGVKLSKDALDLFKRVGIDTIPFLKELRSNVDYFDAHGLPSPTQKQIDEWADYQKTIAAAGTVFDDWMRKAKAFAAGGFIGFASAGRIGGAMLGGALSGVNPLGVMSFGGGTSASGMPTRPNGIVPPPISMTAGSPSAAASFRAFLAGGVDVESARSKLSDLKRQLDEARNAGSQLLGPTPKTAAAYQDAQAAITSAQTAYTRQSELVKELEKDESRRIANLEKIRDLIFEGSQALVGGSGRGQFVVTGQEVYDANRERLSRQGQEISNAESLQRLRAPTLRRAGETAGMLTYRGIGNEYGGDTINLPEGMQLGAHGFFVSPTASRLGAGDEASPEQQQERANGILTSERARRDLRLSAIAAETQATVRLLEFRGEHGEEISTARQIAVIRLDALHREAAITGDTVKLREESVQVELDARLRIAEVQKRQFESISRTSADLYSTLFTNPAGFGRQLGSTLRNATLSPITQGLGNMTASLLYSPIFGGGGTGGISGMLHGAFGGGRTGPIGTVSDPIAVNVVGAGGGASGGGGGVGYIPSIGGGGGDFGLGGGVGGGGGFGFPGAPGGTSGFGGPVSLGGGGIFGGGGGGGRGFGGFNLASLRSNFFNSSSIALGGGRATTAAGIGGFGGNLAGVLTSQGAASLYTAAGVPLALSGLTGSHRGTTTGIFEGAAGGALTGAGIGTMIMPGIGTAIGAGVGALAGFGIGLGEKIAGVESERTQAKRLALSMYGVSISNSAADQIVNIAKSNYGGMVGVAMRSPEVRQMIGLYSAGTGQGVAALSSLTPHGAGLYSQGGSTFQQESYIYGNPYSYQSSFPVQGGGGGQYPAMGGGPTQISLNISGAAVAPFMTGQYVTPDFVQGSMSSALRASNGRVDNALAYSEPGAIRT